MTHGVRPRSTGLFTAVLVSLCLLPAWGQSTFVRKDDPEAQLVRAIELAREGRASDSIAALEDLLERQPNFRLAQLIYADMIAARSGVPGLFVPDDEPQVKELFEEARLRLDRERYTPPLGMAPDAVLQLSDEYPYLVLIDLPGARLHLLKNENGKLTPIGNRYAAMGRGGYGKKVEGDLRTPLGVYHVTGWRSDASLPELYGKGALPLNYPNHWDRFKLKTGYGIWLHGVPRQTYVRAPRSSEGCVTMANDDLLWLRPFVEKTSAPVVLTDKLEWVPKSRLQNERVEALDRIERWRKAWSDNNTESYLGFYRDDFSISGMNKQQFSVHKRRVNRKKTFINIDLTDVSLFRYPGESMLLAEFTIDYKSSNFNFKAKKEQYWRQDAQGRWGIFREENR